MLSDYVVDLHIHIGRTKSNQFVKISAAPSLTLENIMYTAANVKGIDIVGVIDCHVPELLQQITQSIEKGEANPLQGGGIQYENVTLFLGTEIELYDDDGQGPIHVILFFPTMEAMQTCSHWLSERMKNITLSSQRVYERTKIVQRFVRSLHGLFIPAHVFTPFKSLYGRGVKKSLTEILEPTYIDAIELGLSSNTMMADEVEELHPYTYLSNSDAHSLEKMAREYQMVRLKEPTFDEFRLALRREQGRKIVANYGLNPLLGKYYETICASCDTVIRNGSCENCNGTRQIQGVAERIRQLGGNEKKKVERPPYVHQVPLEFIPKVGKKTLERLRHAFGTDMNIIHHVTKAELLEVVSPTIATNIVQARKGDVCIEAGGGGTYGKIKTK